MTEKEMWEQFCSLHPDRSGTPYEAWCYGSDTPDELAALTVKGIKTATASAYPFYEYEQCALPKPGDCDLILNTAGEALCIIETTRVRVMPFCEVDEEQAYREGEGDRSLAFWRRVHQEVFTHELTEIDSHFSEQMLVVCQEFKVVFPEKEALAVAFSSAGHNFMPI